MRGKMIGLLAVLLFALLGFTSTSLGAANANVGSASLVGAAAMASLIAQPTLALALQEQGAPPADKKVDVDININRGGRWYVSPTWVAIGVIGLALLLVLVMMAARGGGSGPTIVSK